MIIKVSIEQGGKGVLQKYTLIGITLKYLCWFIVTENLAFVFEVQPEELIVTWCWSNIASFKTVYLFKGIATWSEFTDCNFKVTDQKKTVLHFLNLQALL